MKTTKLGRWNPGIGRAAWKRCLLATGLVLGLLPGVASATMFSFGAVNPGDVITKLSLAPGTTKTTYNPVTNIMHIEAYLTTIDFSNRASITGIASNTILFTSDVMMVSGTFNVVTGGGATNPRSLSAGFMNGALQDFSIFDTINAISLLDADYIGNLAFSATENGSVSLPTPISGQLTGSLTTLATGDPDFLNAFGPLGTLNAQYSSFFSDGVSTGTVTGNLCHLVVNDGLSGATSWPTTCPGTWGLDDFSVNAGLTIQPVPESGTALLLGLGLLGVAALKRK